ncbi:MAG: tetratricopeptide repeat protein, partial [Planctomycetota bacterium]
RIALERGQSDEARELLSRIEEDTGEHDAALGLLARLDFAENCHARGGRAACEGRLRQGPDDLDARYDLATCLAAEGDYEGALEELLRVVSADRNHRDQAAKEAMVRIFSLIGPRSELADTYRRKLAGVLY